MPSNLLLAAALQVGPFYQQKPAEDYLAVRPFYAAEGEVTDVCWPLFTKHRDWWNFCILVHEHDYADGFGYQFSVVPLWFNGRDAEKGGFAGLFPVAGYHPHVGMMYDFKFALWPLWHQYRMPRTVYRDGSREERWLTSNAVLFPFVSWRSDGAWSMWPVYGVNYQRESDHRYALWPIVTWAEYRDDRDTAGDGYSWMAWPLYARVRRRYERQDSVLPPFFSIGASWSKRPAAVDRPLPPEPDSLRIRCPWPLVEWESTPARRRLSIWPLYERVVSLDYLKGGETACVTRFGWKLVEIFDDETRVFPFWASGRGHFRLWPFWESEERDGVARGGTLALMPIRWVPQIDRNWSKFWTFYERESCPVYTDHSLLWGIFRWRTFK